MATNVAMNVNKKTLVVITGASRGIGATIALELAKLIKHSTFVLIARSKTDLDEVTSKITDNTVITSTVDLAKPDSSTLQTIFEKLPTDFEQKIIFHNAGQVGTLDKTSELTDLQKWREYYDLNLFSVSLLNSVFLKTFSNVKLTFVVNISSLCGSVAFKNMAMYGSGKAARNLFFKVLAAEEPDVSVLNYSPGPVDTDMVTEVIGNIKDTSVRSEFVKLREEKIILTPKATVEKLLGLIVEGGYKSGDLVDYYDRAI